MGKKPLRKKKSKKRASYIQKHWGNITLAFIIFTLCFTAFYYYNYTFYKRIPPEDKKHETKVLPKKLEKKVKNVAADEKTLRIPILIYHYVEYVQDKGDTIRQSLSTTPYIFEEQIKTLKNSNYVFLTMKDIADILDRKKSTPEKAVVLTFDDGYRDFYTDVYPILKKYNVRAVAYLVPGFFDKPNYMFTSQVEEIAKNGLVEIGAHTMHHAALKEMNATALEYEVKESKKELEEKFHIAVVSFAYPYGAFDEQAIEMVKKAGFKTAVSTIPGINENPLNRYYLFRLRPGYRTDASLLNFFQQESFKPW